MIGSTKQTVANQLCGKRRFSINMAQKYNEKLGYSIEFLLYGQGPLYAPGRLIWHPRPGSLPELLGRADDPMMKEMRIIAIASHILEIINDKIALECFEKAVKGDNEESDRLMDILEERYGYNIPILTRDPKITKAFRELRDWCRGVEILAAKRLVLIEQKAALGEIDEVEAEVERFRQRILVIKERYKDEITQSHPDISESDYMTDEEREALRSFYQKKEAEL